MHAYINMLSDFVIYGDDGKLFIIDGMTNKLKCIIPLPQIYANITNFDFCLYSNGILLWFYEKHGIVFIDRTTGEILWQRTDIKFRQNHGFYYEENNEYVVAKGTKGGLHIIDQKTGKDTGDPIDKTWQIYSWPNRPFNLRVMAGKILICKNDLIIKKVPFKWDTIQCVDVDQSGMKFIIVDHKLGICHLDNDCLKMIDTVKFSRPRALSYVEANDEFHIIGYDHASGAPKDAYAKIASNGELIEFNDQSPISGFGNFVGMRKRIVDWKRGGRIEFYDIVGMKLIDQKDRYL